MGLVKRWCLSLSALVAPKFFFGRVFVQSSSFGAQKRERESVQKVGLPPISERAPKSAQKGGFAHFLVLFLKLAEALLSAHFHVLAFWAPRLEPKYTTLSGHDPDSTPTPIVCRFSI